ncbi:MAG: peptidoglycan editing factor PgeF [Candidatus Nanopelagicales bacterium]
MTHWYGQVAGAAGTAHWLFTSRRGGVSAAPFDDWNLAMHVGDDAADVLRNRAAVALAGGFDPQRMVMMRQCHSNAVEVVGAAQAPEIQGVDGLVTSEHGTGVVALSADCVPISLVDADAGVVAAVHSGWQGMVNDVVGSALDAMVALGADPGRTRASLGPAICGPCYPVPPERADEAADAWSDSRATAPDGQPAIDVRAGLRQRLRQAGVFVEYIGGCTAEDPQLFSYRRDGLTGRQGVAVWWTQN